MARISLHNMTFYGFHGVSAAERETGRRFEVDCELFVDIARATESDRLADAVNYTAVYGVVERIVQQHKFNLLETVAARIARELKGEFGAQRVIVRVRKKIPPIPGNLDHIEVEFDSDVDMSGESA
ncbi:MAG TPA: dihydroneopterin aldolase [candidate division Zixibacteria bacterium]